MTDSLNETQIRMWLTEGKVDLVLSFISTLKDQRDRAELQTRSYMHQIQELSKRTKAILDPILERSTNPTEPKPKPQKPTKSSLDIAINL